MILRSTRLQWGNENEIVLEIVKELAVDWRRIWTSGTTCKTFMETKLFFRDEHRLRLFEKGSAIATDTATIAGIMAMSLKRSTSVLKTILLHIKHYHVTPNDTEKSLMKGRASECIKHHHDFKLWSYFNFYMKFSQNKEKISKCPTATSTFSNYYHWSQTQHLWKDYN